MGDEPLAGDAAGVGHRGARAHTFDAVFGRRVALLRRLRGMSQQALADALGDGGSRARIAMIETGRQAVSLETAYRFERVLGRGLLNDPDVRSAANGESVQRVRWYLPGVGL